MTSPAEQGRATPDPAPAVCSPATHTLEAGVAHIEDTLCPHFSGHVGPVRFRRGHAETDDPDLVDYFREQPERYVVAETDEPPSILTSILAQQRETWRERHGDPGDDDPQE